MIDPTLTAADADADADAMLPNLSALSAAPTGGDGGEGGEAMGRAIGRRNARRDAARGGRAPPSTNPPPYDEPGAEGVVWEPGLDPPADFELAVHQKLGAAERAREAYEAAPSLALATAWSDAVDEFMSARMDVQRDAVNNGVAFKHVFAVIDYYDPLVKDAREASARAKDKWLAAAAHVLPYPRTYR